MTQGSRIAKAEFGEMETGGGNSLFHIEAKHQKHFKGHYWVLLVIRLGLKSGCLDLRTDKLEHRSLPTLSHSINECHFPILAKPQIIFLSSLLLISSSFIYTELLSWALPRPPYQGFSL